MRDHRVLSMSTLSLFLAFAASACGSQFESGTPPLPTGTVPVKLQEVARGLAFPLYLTAPPDDPRLFVVEKGGAIRIIKGGTLLPLPFLDLAGQVSTGSEQGLLGLAFDPGLRDDRALHRALHRRRRATPGSRPSTCPPIPTVPTRPPSPSSSPPTSRSPTTTAGRSLSGPMASLSRPGRWRLRRRSQRHRQGLRDLLGSILRISPGRHRRLHRPARQSVRRA